MGIGTLRCVVVDVDDIEVGVAFWSALTGIARISSRWPEDYAYLGYEDETTWKHEMILHRVSTPKRADGVVDRERRVDSAANRGHIDITVDDIDVAIEQIEAIGGRLKYPPTVYPVPHQFEDARPLIDWAVMQDPFGNEFCLVRELTSEERQALCEAAAAGPADDAHWRAVAREVRYGGSAG